MLRSNKSKKIFSTDINKLKRQPPNANCEVLPHYEGVYELRQNNHNFEPASEILMKEYDKMVLKNVLRGYIILWSVNRT